MAIESVQTQIAAQIRQQPPSPQQARVAKPPETRQVSSVQPEKDTTTVQSPPVQSEQNDMLKQQVEEFVQSMSKAHPSLNFQVDDVLNRVVVEVRDRESGEMIRQIPSEEILRMARRFKEMAESKDPTGLMLSTKA